MDKLVLENNTNEIIKSKLIFFTKSLNLFLENKKKVEELTSEISTLKISLKDASTSMEKQTQEIKKKDAEIQILTNEKQDKMTQLEKLQSGSSEEMKELHQRLKTLEGEKRNLLFEKSDLERYRDEAISSINKAREEYLELEIQLRDKVKDLENENTMIKRGFEEDMKEGRARNEQLRDQITEIIKEKDQLIRVNNKLEEKVSFMEKQHSDFNTFKDTIVITTKKIIKNYEPIESNLSCLSCLEFLEDPLMLICGHSICLKCFKTHSDPQSKDSIVFCEECKVETKNKELMESKVIEIL